MKKKSKIPDFIRNDFLRKFLAFAFAFLAWFYVNSKVNQQSTYKNIRVKVITSNAKQIITGEATTISLSLRGSDNELQKLHSADIRVQVTIPEGINAGILELPITEKNIITDSLNGLKVHRILDKKVLIPVDIIREKLVPVKVIYKNEMASHLALLKEPLPQPAKVKIIGPSPRLRDIDHIYTDTVLFDSKRQRSFTTPATMIAPSGIKFLDDYNKVTVKVPLTEVKAKRQITEVPVQIMFQGSSGRHNLIIYEKLDILIEGPPDTIKNVKPESDIQLFVLVDNKEFKSEYPVQFWSRHPDVEIDSSFSRTIALSNAIQGQ